MSIQPHTFCWQGISTDMVKGQAFYTGVFGWSVTMTPGDVPMLVGPGGAVAHLQAPEGGPAAWCSYLSVADLDQSTAAAEAEGGRVVVPPTPLPVGRFSVVATPSGAVLGLYEPTAEDELAKPGPGSVHWVDLRSHSLDEDLRWLGAVFGFTHRVEQMPSGPYHLLELDGAIRGGAVSAGEGPSHFMPWVHVTDLDATLEQVVAHGGATEAPFGDPSVGRMAVVADPGEARFGVIQPA